MIGFYSKPLSQGYRPEAARPCTHTSLLMAILLCLLLAVQAPKGAALMFGWLLGTVRPVLSGEETQCLLEHEANLFGVCSVGARVTAATPSAESVQRQRLQPGGVQQGTGGCSHQWWPACGRSSAASAAWGLQILTLTCIISETKDRMKFVDVFFSEWSP